MADVKMEGFPSKDAAAKWAHDRLVDFEEMEFATRQAEEYLAMAKETQSVSDAEKAHRYAGRAGVAAIGVESDMAGEERKPGPYYKDAEKLQQQARAFWGKLEPEILYEIS